MPYCLVGFGQYTSLQELLLGFTNGTLSRFSNQQHHLVEPLSYTEEICCDKEIGHDYSIRECEPEVPEISLGQGCVESEEDNEHEGSIDGEHTTPFFCRKHDVKPS